MRRCWRGRKNIFPIAERENSELSASHWRRLDSFAVDSDLGVQRIMNGIPLISILTLTPLAGALILIGLDARQKGLARKIGLGFSLLSLVLVAILWSGFNAVSG